MFSFLSLFFSLSLLSSVPASCGFLPLLDPVPCCLYDFRLACLSLRSLAQICSDQCVECSSKTQLVVWNSMTSFRFKSMPIFRTRFLSSERHVPQSQKGQRAPFFSDSACASSGCGHWATTAVCCYKAPIHQSATLFRKTVLHVWLFVDLNQAAVSFLAFAAESSPEVFVVIVLQLPLRARSVDRGLQPSTSAGTRRSHVMRYSASV